MLRLTIERQKKGWTKLQLGNHSGIHPAQIGKLEAGRVVPYEPEKRRLEMVFGIHAAKLFEEVEEEIAYRE